LSADVGVPRPRRRRRRIVPPGTTLQGGRPSPVVRRFSARYLGRRENWTRKSASDGGSAFAIDARPLFSVRRRTGGFEDAFPGLAARPDSARFIAGRETDRSSNRQIGRPVCGRSPLIGPAPSSVRSRFETRRRRGICMQMN